MSPLTRSLAARCAALLMLTPAAPHAVRADNPCDPAIVVFDASGSMRGSRIAQAREAAARILPRIGRERPLGLVTYGRQDAGPDRCATVRLALAPRNDAHAAILAIINELAPGGGTPLTEGVSEAIAALGGVRQGSGSVLLITDGEENCRGDPCTLGHQIAEARSKIKVHVIGFRLRVAEGGRLACLAEKTGGHYVVAEDTDALAASMDQVLSCNLVSRLPYTPEHGRVIRSAGVGIGGLP